MVTDAKARKALPLCTGVLDYFPDALLAVAECSRVGNDQHNPGQPLHWAKEKSTDEADALLRHLAERGTLDADGVRHSAKVAWRALALLQREIEAERQATGVPLPSSSSGVTGDQPVCWCKAPTLPGAGGSQLCKNGHWTDRDRDRASEPLLRAAGYLAPRQILCWCGAVAERRTETGYQCWTGHWCFRP